ncbi:MAG: iron-containing alcohol dehydrogenase, partial [Lachnospiraceae bacterium]|nr:iron-containing alcohol dehydrogenase [Lachnospiraceae bacterium]
MSCTFNQLCPVLFGAGAAAETGRVAKEQGITRALIMADPKVVELGLTKKVEASLDEAGIPYVIYDGIETDAPDYTVVEAGKMGEEFGADGIIGIGGGSTLDAAKAASVLNGSDISRDELMAPIPQVRPQVKNIMVPTTSGTGSENTVVAVVTNTETHYKTG